MRGKKKGKAEEVKFAHHSEKEFACLFDYYQLKWEYEPRTFTLEWDNKGNPKSQITPDFYLPEYDLYVEVTTLRQKLITKKNKKVRLLKELYPEINIKILKKRDFKNLMLKYGREM